jgi:hypothetical protein
MNSSFITPNNFQLALVRDNIYKPVFDVTTGKYVDESPILPRQTMEFKCLCNQKTFNTNTKFKQHASLKCHQRYVACYLDHLQDEKDLKEEMKRMRETYELNERKLKFEIFGYQAKLKEIQDRLEYSEKMIQQIVNPHHKYSNMHIVTIEDKLNG